MAKKLIELPKPYVDKHVKSNLAEEISRMNNPMHPKKQKFCYCCQIGKGGFIQMLETWDHSILTVNYFLVAKAHIDEVGLYSVVPEKDVELSAEDLDRIEKDVDLAIHANWEFFKKESAFVRWLDRHADKINGLTPEVAIAYIYKEYPFPK